MTDHTISSANTSHLTAWPTTQKVVIVNGGPEMLDSFEAILDAGHYDIVFVESSAHAYSQVKRVHPDLVILCLQIDDREALQVLSMLKLDHDTRSIPVLTYTVEEYDGEDMPEEPEEVSDSEVFLTPKGAFLMN